MTWYDSNVTQSSHGQIIIQVLIILDRCFTGSDRVADGCFLALATIFSARREYPCDHYTAIINVTLMNTGCPRTNIHETALQLLQILDKRFFGSVSPLDSVGADGSDQVWPLTLFFVSFL